MPPKLSLSIPDYVVLVVSELERSLVFYTEVLGLPLGHRSGSYAQLDTGSTRVALYERGAMATILGTALRRPAPDAPAFELGFKVEDVDAAYRSFVEAGAESACAPTDRDWGQRTAYLRDPDGYLVELAGPASDPGADTPQSS